MIVQVEHLTKIFNKFTILDDLSFSIEAGEIVGLVGPNGAGKTTTIHMLLHLISPSKGQVRIFGKHLEANRQEILQQMNFAAPYLSYPSRLTVRENLDVFARLYGVKNARSKIAHLLEMFAVERLKDTPISKLSSGQIARVGLCKALLNDPKLLLLDEPTAYLDPQIAQEVRCILKDLRQRCGTTILYTSHNMVEIEELCNRICFLNKGRMIASGSALEVTQTLLQEERHKPALAEVFLRVTAGQVQ